MSGVLITGAAGSVGQALLRRLGNEASGTDVAWYDRHLDVTDRDEVDHWVQTRKPELIYHLAGAKHAFDGELDPERVTEINVMGTRHVLDAAAGVGAKVIFSSTCKACDPETAYGASKLIAERMVLNAGQVVVRYYNIIQSSGNVFRLWETVPVKEPIPFTDCWRYFISMDEALYLTTSAKTLPCGRYAFNPGLPQHMSEVARRYYPRRETVEVARRRGDRFREPLHADCESMWQTGFKGICEIRSPYDFKPEQELPQAA